MDTCVVAYTLTKGLCRDQLGRLVPQLERVFAESLYLKGLSTTEITNSVDFSSGVTCRLNSANVLVAKRKVVFQFKWDPGQHSVTVSLAFSGKPVWQVENLVQCVGPAPGMPASNTLVKGASTCMMFIKAGNIQVSLYMYIDISCIYPLSQRGLPWTLGLPQGSLLYICGRQGLSFHHL